MDELYREVLLEHYRNPVHKGKLIKPDIHKEDSNPLCGDTIEIFLRIDKDEKVVGASFEGKGCVISMASADLLLEEIKGKTLKEVNAMGTEEILDLIGLNLTHTRVKCAMLGLIAIKKGILEAKK